MADAYSYLVAVFLIATIAVNFIINVVVLVMMKNRRLYVIVANRLFLQFVLIDFIACFFVFVPASVTAIVESWAFSDPACHIHGVITTFVYIVIFGLLIVRCVERITKIKNRNLHKAVFCSNCRLMLVSSVVWVVGVFVAVIPLSGWLSFKYDYYHSGCIVQLEESILYIFLLFTLGVALTAIFVIIAFMIVSKADKNVGDIERINGGKGWHMGNGSKPEENKNPNMATASANLIISTVSVVFFFPYFVLMFIRAAGEDMWRGAYSICLIPVVLTFTLRPLIYLFRLRMTIKAKEKNAPRTPGDKKRILAVSRRGKRDRPPGNPTEKNKNPTEPTYSSDEWSEYDDDKDKNSCFSRKAKKYDENESPDPPPYEYNRSHPRPSQLHPTKGNNLTKEQKDPVYKKPNRNNPKVSDVDEEDMSEFYLDGNSSENDVKSKPKNPPGLNENKLHTDPKMPNDQKNKRSNEKPSNKLSPKITHDTDASNSDSGKQKIGDDPKSFLSPRMIHIKENPRTKKQNQKKLKNKSDEEEMSDEMPEDGRKSKKKRRRNKRRPFKEDSDENSSYYSYSDNEKQPKGKQKTKIIVIKQGIKSNSPQSKRSNRIAPKESEPPIVEEKLRKQNKLNPFFRPGMTNDKKYDKLKEEDSLSSEESDSKYTDESKDDSGSNKRSRKKMPRKNLKKQPSTETKLPDDSTENDDVSNRSRKKGNYMKKRRQRTKDPDDSSNDENHKDSSRRNKHNDTTDDEADDDNKRRRRLKKKRSNRKGDSQTDTDSVTTDYKIEKGNARKTDSKNTINDAKNKPYHRDSKSPTAHDYGNNQAKTNHGDNNATQGKKNDKPVDEFRNDETPGLDKGTLEEMLQKNMDAKISPVINNNYYIIDPTRMGISGDGNSKKSADSKEDSEEPRTKSIPQEAIWKNSDPNIHPTSDSKLSETKQSQPRFFNNAPVNDDNLPESKSKMTVDDNSNEIVNNLGPGETLEPYKRRRLVPENSEGTQEKAQDNNWNPSETMGPGNPLLPYSEDDNDDPNDPDSNDLEGFSTNRKEDTNPIDIMGPGEKMEPFENGTYNPRDQRKLQKNLERSSPDDMIDDENSQSLKNNGNRTPDLTRILGQGDPIIPHDSKVHDDPEHNENHHDSTGRLPNHLVLSINNPTDSLSNQNNPYMNFPNELENISHPYFANPYDGNGVSQTHPYHQNPSDFRQFPQTENPALRNEIPYHDVGDPQRFSRDAKYPFVSNQPSVGQVSNNSANYPNQPHQPEIEETLGRLGDFNQGQNYPYYDDNPSNDSYPYNANDKNDPSNGNNLNRYENPHAKIPSEFDPYNMKKDEKRENAPNNGNENAHKPLLPNKSPKGVAHFSQDPNTSVNKKHNPRKTNNRKPDIKSNKSESKGYEPHPSEAEKMSRQSDPTDQGNIINGKQKQPSIPRTNMTKPKHFEDDHNRNYPNHMGSGEENPYQFQYVKPQTLNNSPPSMPILNENALDPQNQDTSGQANTQNNPYLNPNAMNPADTSVVSIPPHLLPSGNQPTGNAYPDLQSDSHLDPNHEAPNSAIQRNTRNIPKNAQTHSDWDTPLPVSHPMDSKFIPKEIGPPKSYSSINQKPVKGRVRNPNVLAKPNGKQIPDDKTPTGKHPYGKEHEESNHPQELSKNPSVNEPRYVSGRNDDNQGPNSSFYPERFNPLNGNKTDNEQLDPNDLNPNLPQKVNIGYPIGPPKSYSSIRQKPKEGRAVKIDEPTTNRNQSPLGNGNLGIDIPHVQRIPKDTEGNSKTRGLNQQQTEKPNNPEHVNNNNPLHQQQQTTNDSKLGKKKLDNISNPYQYENPPSNGSSNPVHSDGNEYPHDGKNNGTLKNPSGSGNPESHDRYNGQHPGNRPRNERLRGHNVSGKQQHSSNPNGSNPNDIVQSGNNQGHLNLNVDNPNQQHAHPIPNNKRDNLHGNEQNHSSDKYQNNRPNPQHPTVPGGSNSLPNENMPNKNKYSNQPQSEGESNLKSKKRVSFDNKRLDSKDEDKTPKPAQNNLKAKRDLWGKADQKMSVYYHMTRIDKWDMVHGYDNKYDKSGKAKQVKNGGWKKETKDIDLL